MEGFCCISATFGQAVPAFGRAQSKACPGGQLAASPVISATTRWWIPDSAARLSRLHHGFGVNK
jgi:hypothetical protein